MADQFWESSTPLGAIRVHHDVIVEIAERALEKVEGARALRGGPGLRGFFGSEEPPRVVPAEGGVNVEIGIAVAYGYPVHEVAQGVQQAVREDLSKLGGVNVRRVDVFVKKVLPPTETLVFEEGGENA